MIHNRPAALTQPVALLVALSLAGPLLAGCGDPGELRGAGPTSVAVGPTRLWPQVPPAASPAVDYGEADTETVKGVPGGASWNGTTSLGPPSRRSSDAPPWSVGPSM